MFRWWGLLIVCLTLVGCSDPAAEKAGEDSFMHACGGVGFTPRQCKFLLQINDQQPTKEIP